MLILDTSLFTNISKQTYTFLPTAIVLIDNAYGVPMAFRAILDIGSNENVITEELARVLDFSLCDSNMQIPIIGGRGLENNNEIITTIRSRNQLHRNYAKNITCLVVPQLHSPLPRDVDWEENSAIFASHSHYLADEEFNRAGNVDMILGVGVVFDIMLDGEVELQNGAYLKESKLGWIVGGTIETTFESFDTTTTVNLRYIPDGSTVTEDSDDPDDVSETQSPASGSDLYTDAYYNK